MERRASRCAMRIAGVAAVSILLQARAQTPAQASLTLRTGAMAGIQAVDASPDGKWYATLGGDGAVTVWSIADGFQYRTFSTLATHTTPSMGGAVSISPDAKTIATANGNAIRLWDVRTASASGEIKPQKAFSISRIVYHPSQNLIASLDTNGTVRVNDAVTGARLFEKQIDSAGQGSVYVSPNLRFSPDGTLLALSTPNAVHVFAWEKKQEFATLDAHAFHAKNLGRKIRAMALTPQGMSPEVVTAEQLHTFEISDIAFDPEIKSRLAILHRDEVTLVDLASQKTIDTVSDDQPKFTACVFTPGRQLLVGVLAGKGFRYNLATRERTEFPAESVSQFVPVPAANRLLVQFGTVTGYVRVGDLGLSGQWYSSNTSKTAQAWQFRFSPDGQELVGSLNWGTAPMTVWDLTSGEEDNTVLPMQGIMDFTLSPDGTLLAYFGVEGWPNYKVHVWDRRKRQEVVALPIRVPGPVKSLGFSPDGSRLAASIGEPKGIRVWSIPDGKQLGQIPLDEPYSRNRVAWSKDNRTLAISKNGGVLIYDMPKGATPQQKAAIDEPQGAILFADSGLSFSPSGDTLAVSGADDIFLYDTSSWSPRGKIEEAQCAAFSADGRRVLYNYRPAKQIITRHEDRGLWSWEIAAGKATVINENAPASCLASQLPGKDVWAAPLNDAIAIVSGTTGQLLATLYVFGGKAADWLVVTPDGLFDGTPGAWTQMSWRFGNETFSVLPVEIFFQQYYRPGLLAQIASGQIPKAATNIANVDRRQPTVTLNTTAQASDVVQERTVHLELTVMEAPGSGARELRLFRNGVLVQPWHGNLLFDNNHVGRFFADVPISAGKNLFTAYAFNDSDVKSPDASLVITGGHQLRRKGTAWVITMGVNRYDASTAIRDFDLRYAEADARDFATQFARAQAALDQFGEVQVLDLTGPRATHTNLEAALRILAGDSANPLTPEEKELFAALHAVQPEDGVFLFYAGHGVAQDDHFYIVPQDFNPHVLLTDPRSNTIPDTRLNDLLEGIAPAHSFFIIDACNSGQAIDNLAGPVNVRGLAQLAYEKGIYILAASMNSEPAQEAEELGGGHGYLTYALVEEGLKRGAAAQDGVIELKPWLSYARRRVPELQTDYLGQRTITVGESNQRHETRQHPRTFYRREQEETNPFVVAKALATTTIQ